MLYTGIRFNDWPIGSVKGIIFADDQKQADEIAVFLKEKYNMDVFFKPGPFNLEITNEPEKGT